jgi:hypothetical protein
VTRGLLDDTSYLAALPPDHPIKRRENVFAFSSAAASAQLLQFLSMVVAPAGIADVRAQLYHFATGKMDVDERNCEGTCLYQREFVGMGDRAPQVTGRHPLAEQTRSNYEASSTEVSESHFRRSHGWSVTRIRKLLRRS